MFSWTLKSEIVKRGMRVTFGWWGGKFDVDQLNHKNTAADILQESGSSKWNWKMPKAKKISSHTEDKTTTWILLFNERTLRIFKNIHHPELSIIYFKTQTAQHFLFLQPRSCSGQLVLSAACCVFPQAGLFVSRVCSSISSPETLITCDCWADTHTKGKGDCKPNSR